jgi:hypothetical protein
MNYVVKAFKIVHQNEKTTLEDYEKPVPNYFEGIREQNRLKSLGHYSNITIIKNEGGH